MNVPIAEPMTILKWELSSGGLMMNTFYSFLIKNVHYIIWKILQTVVAKEIIKGNEFKYLFAVVFVYFCFLMHSSSKLYPEQSSPGKY